MDGSVYGEHLNNATIRNKVYATWRFLGLYTLGRYNEDLLTIDRIIRVTRHSTRVALHRIEGGHQARRRILMTVQEYWWVPHKSPQVGRPSALNDSMIKCHEFPEPRYIIHREQAGSIVHAALTVPRVQQR